MFSVPYTHHFGLKASPFSTDPDPKYLHMSGQHKEALAHLLYGLGTEGGIVLLTGEPGTGKTSICRCLLAELPHGIDVACLGDPQSCVHDVLADACRQFGAADGSAASVKQHVDRLNAFLLDNHARGRRSVLVVDEAQRLSVDVLEQLRLLTNLETNDRKLLQILLIGGPDLRERLEGSNMRQLSQRIVARFHLRPLTVREVREYLRHRLAMVGARPDIVPARLARRIYALTAGVPRTINQLCDRALLDVSTRGDSEVDDESLLRAARRLGLRGTRNTRMQQAGVAAFASFALLICAIVAALVEVGA